MVTSTNLRQEHPQNRCFLKTSKKRNATADIIAKLVSLAVSLRLRKPLLLHKKENIRPSIHPVRIQIHWETIPNNL